MKSLPKGYESWNFLVKNREIISKYLTRDVGKGDEALFWENFWDGFPPIDSMGILGNLKEKLVIAWGSKVCDYRTKIHNDGITRWA